MKGTPISKLHGLSSLGPDDTFIVSEFNASSDSLYYTKAIHYDNLRKSVSADEEISSIRISADINIGLLDQVSTDYLSVQLSVQDFTEKFEDNEISTRMIPRLSSFTMETIPQLSDVLYKDSIYYPRRDDNYNVLLKLFAKNYFETYSPIIKFRIPDFLEGYSRHLYIILNNKSDSWIFFASDKDQLFFSDGKFDKLAGKGVHIFDIKEISKDVFYIKMTDTLYNIHIEDLVGPDQVRNLFQETNDQEGLQEILGTRTPIDLGFQRRMDTWGLGINSNGDQT